MRSQFEGFKVRKKMQSPVYHRVIFTCSIIKDQESSLAQSEASRPASDPQGSIQLPRGHDFALF